MSGTWSARSIGSVSTTDGDGGTRQGLRSAQVPTPGLGVTLASSHALFLLQTICESAVSAFPPVYIGIQSVFHTYCQRPQPTSHLSWDKNSCSDFVPLLPPRGQRNLSKLCAMQQRNTLPHPWLPWHLERDPRSSPTSNTARDGATPPPLLRLHLLPVVSLLLHDCPFLVHISFQMPLLQRCLHGPACLPALSPTPAGHSSFQQTVLSSS